MDLAFRFELSDEQHDIHWLHTYIHTCTFFESTFCNKVKILAGFLLTIYLLEWSRTFPFLVYIQAILSISSILRFIIEPSGYNAIIVHGALYLGIAFIRLFPILLPDPALFEPTPWRGRVI